MLYIWLGVIVALLMVEFLSKNFTAVCFAISAVISLIFVNTTTNNYITQVAIFLIGGILLMIFVRPNVLNLIKDLKDKKKNQKKEVSEAKKEETKEIEEEPKKQNKKGKKNNKKKNANK